MKIKRIATLVAAGLLAVQMLGVGTAFAGGTSSECDFGSDNLEVTIGDDDVAIWIDDEGMFYCDEDDDGTWEYEQLAKTLDTVVAEMDDEDSEGSLVVYLDDTDSSFAEWPDFKTFDLDVAHLELDASSVDYQNVRISTGPKSVSWNGTTATSTVAFLEIEGTDYRDFIDGSKGTARLEVYANAGNDTIVGSAFKDYIQGDDDLDKIYGGAGNDYVDCGDDGSYDDKDYEYGWGQDGDDYIYYCDVVAPGAGDDYIEGNSGSFIATYEDLKVGMSWKNKNEGSYYVTTGGGAGDDDFYDYPDVIKGTQGDDVLVDLYGSMAFGNGGNDYIVGPAVILGGGGNDRLYGLDSQSDYLSGGAGDDVLKGKSYDDTLIGGPGRDQLWAGGGIDTCVSGEVLNSCNLIRTVAAQRLGWSG